MTPVTGRPPQIGERLERLIEEMVAWDVPLEDAVREFERRFILRVLAGCEIEFATDASCAGAALGERAFDLVIVGIYVQESRALEVLSAVRLLAPAVPAICVRAAEPKSRMSGGTLQAFRLACAQLGAKGVVDFLQFPNDRSGDAAIRAEIGTLARREPGRRRRA